MRWLQNQMEMDRQWSNQDAPDLNMLGDALTADDAAADLPAAEAENADLVSWAPLSTLWTACCITSHPVQAMCWDPLVWLECPIKTVAALSNFLRRYDGDI